VKWRKLGRVFAPQGLGTWSHSHAAVPCGWRLEEHRWRIYYASRDAASRSHTCYFDLDPRRPEQLLRVGQLPVLVPGGLGSFDEDGAMPSWLLAYQDRLLLFYTGWNRGVTVPFRNAIGVAESLDGGETFTRFSEGPVLDRNVYDPFFTASPCVLADGVGWRLWYLSGVAWEPHASRPRHRYLIRYAEDAGDPFSWRPTGSIAIDLAGPDEIALARPCVLRDDDRYRMWYSHRGASYRIGYAESSDGLSWTRMDEAAGIDVADSGWDSEMIAYPFVFDASGKRFMLYNGNGYGETGIGIAVLESD
jgi:hypothetical protein